MAILTPLMRQYQEVKEQYPDCLVFFRLGDFYEMFADDAGVAAHELGIVLTARDGGGGTKVPMCGVPHHASENYISRLIDKGYKVAICEQMEDPKTTKGLVKREVVRVITKGTIIEENMLKGTANNYLAACWLQVQNNKEQAFGLAYTDISTGKFYATEIKGDDIRNRLCDELSRIRPAELILPPQLVKDEMFSLRLLNNSVESLTPCTDIEYLKRSFKETITIHFKVANLAALGLEESPATAMACAMVLDFLLQTQKRSLEYISELTLYNTSEYLTLDFATRKNLELTTTMRSGERVGSLLWVLDQTLTPMGSRTLRDWLDNPLLSSEAINRRLQAVDELVHDPMLMAELREVLHSLYDMQRLITRVAYGNASPRDLLALKNSLAQQPAILAILSRLKSPLFMFLVDMHDLLGDIHTLIEQAIADDAPVSAKDPGVIKPGYNAEADQLRQLTASTRELILALEEAERNRSGIRTLKVGYNKVFGYYIEVPKSRVEEAPEDYIRKQTLTNGERYITEELKELEGKILGAGERLAIVEYQLFCAIREKVSAATTRINATAEVCSYLDVLQSYATVAIKNNYCLPQVDDSNKIIIREGRHPVIEKTLAEKEYIPNDTYLDQTTQRMMLITGPNMAGKSTYMRQVALITLMARIGSFVPADAAQIGYINRIFTRVGASDDLFAGQSTFMVEMTETSNILRHANQHSLIILDEIGRGTSTYDGLSIAWAVAEYIINENCAAKTLFATHYHELTALAEKYPLIKNFSIAVKEQGAKIVFLRKIIEGGADRSYGIHVAQLAGLPGAVIKRAGSILQQLEKDKQLEPAPVQLSLMDNIDDYALPEEDNEIIREIKEIDIDSISPLDALLTISKWKKELKDE